MAQIRSPSQVSEACLAAFQCCKEVVKCPRDSLQMSGGMQLVVLNSVVAPSSKLAPEQETPPMVCLLWDANSLVEV